MEIKMDYPLICDFCGIKEPITNRKIYSVEIKEVGGDPISSRIITICAKCFGSKDIAKILKEQGREF